MITSKIFERSQRHEWVDIYDHENFSYRLKFYMKIQDWIREIKPFQTVTKRYVLDNQYWEQSHE